MADYLDQNETLEERSEENDVSTSRQHSGYHHHYRKHRSPWQKFKDNVSEMLYKHQWIIPVTLIALVVMIGGAVWMYSTFKQIKGSHLTAGNPSNVGGGYRNISYKGRNYRYNNRITCILYAGIDANGDFVPNKLYRFGARADSISMIVLDEYHKKMSVVAINRNTITKIHKFTLYGYDRGEFVDQVGLSFCYGDNGEASCENLCKAVSTLFYGIPINDYIVSNRSSMQGIASFVGDVKVTVPNNDLVKYGFNQGDTVVINQDNIERFLRTRDIEVEYSNKGRMERQKVYINSAVDRIVDQIKNSPSDVWRRLNQLENYMMTNITRNRYIDLTNALANTAYSEQNYYSPDGILEEGPEFDEFYVDEDQLLDKIIELFYLEV